MEIVYGKSAAIGSGRIIAMAHEQGVGGHILLDNKPGTSS